MHANRGTKSPHQGSQEEIGRAHAKDRRNNAAERVIHRRLN